jgi:hypothetical protein
MTSLYVYDNPMKDAARKAIELELVLRQMRNPNVAEIDASNKGFDYQDAIKIGEGLRRFLDLIAFFFLDFFALCLC